MRIQKVKTDLKFDTILLTPEVAQEFIEKQGNNRKVKTSVVKRYAREITRKSNGGPPIIYQPIMLDEQGHMLDGQQRCNAVIEAGMPVVVTRIQNVPASEWMNLDQGAKRGLADMFTGYTEKNATILGGLIRLCFEYRSGTWSACAAQVSHEEAYSMFKKDARAFREACSAVSGRSELSSVMGSTKAAFIRYHCSYYEDQIDDFFRRVEGIGVKSANDPARRFTSAHFDALKGRRNIPRWTKMALLIKAVNADLQGKPIRCLKINPDEKFPRLLAEFGKPMKGDK